MTGYNGPVTIGLAATSLISLPTDIAPRKNVLSTLLHATGTIFSSLAWQEFLKMAEQVLVP